MDVESFGDLAIDRLEEREELGVAVAWEALADHRPAQHIERGEQGGGPVALVVVSHRPGAAFLHRQRRLGAIQRLDLRFLVHAQDHGLLRRVQIQPDDVDEFLLEPRVVGQLEGLDPMRLQPAGGPDPLHRRRRSSFSSVSGRSRPGQSGRSSERGFPSGHHQRRRRPPCDSSWRMGRTLEPPSQGSSGSESRSLGASWPRPRARGEPSGRGRGTSVRKSRIPKIRESLIRQQATKHRYARPATWAARTTASKAAETLAT